MTISEWLDQKEADGIDVSKIELPSDLSFDEEPAETLYFKEIRPCGMLCSENHPFSMVQRYGHWYIANGQDKNAGIHSSGMEWKLTTKDKNLVIKTAQSHIE
ncbi:MAG TPA: hypothetical protein VK452_06570 [Dissulfurispiraceae bacterium]|nr:hypothetical protein [Dissulfurispiraceae bacterium]